MSITKIKNFSQFVNENLNGSEYGRFLMEAESTTPKLESEDGGKYLILNKGLKVPGVDSTKALSFSPFPYNKKTNSFDQPGGMKWSSETRTTGINNAVVKFDTTTSQIGVGTSYSTKWMALSDSSEYDAGDMKTGKESFFGYVNVSALKKSYSISDLKSASKELQPLVQHLLGLSNSLPTWYKEYSSGGYSTPNVQDLYPTDKKIAVMKNVKPNTATLTDPKAISQINTKFVKPYNETMASINKIVSTLGFPNISTGVSSTKGFSKIADVKSADEVYATGYEFFLAWGTLALIEYLITVNESEAEFVKYLTAIAQSKAGVSTAKSIGSGMQKSNPKLTNVSLAFLDGGSSKTGSVVKPKSVVPDNVTPEKNESIKNLFGRDTNLNEAKSCKGKVVKFLKDNDCVVDYEAGTCKEGTKTMKIEKALLKFKAPEALIKSYTQECTKEVNEALRLRRNR